MLALARLPTGWFRVEIATVLIAPEDIRELRERDVVLVDALAQRPREGELVLSSGARFAVSLTVEDAGWIATVGVRLTRIGAADFAINLAYRVVDARELPASGARVDLLTTVDDPLVLSWRDEVFGRGEVVRLDEGAGVRVTSLRRLQTV